MARGLVENLQSELTFSLQITRILPSTELLTADLLRQLTYPCPLNLDWTGRVLQVISRLLIRS